MQINIPKPCAQNWEAMPAAGEGKHCAQCNNVVYDFSQMTDNELLNFFKEQPATHCGRFHTTQLNRAIVPVATKRKLFTTKLNKIAAAFFTILSFRSMALQGAVKKESITTAIDPRFKNNKPAVTDSVVISGTIKDSDGKPLKGATITLDFAQVAVTDQEGKFSFEVKGITAVSHNLYFNYADLVTAVRSYHPSMQSSNYDVILNKRGEGFHTMGIMIPPRVLLNLPSLNFKTNASKLSVDNKVILASIAKRLRENPSANIIVTAYPENYTNQSVYDRRIDNIKKYLVLTEGISADRVTGDYVVGGGDKNTVDMKSGY
jgi:outer membrane protein OmpA-like peptidoglycan-associated protein